MLRYARALCKVLLRCRDYKPQPVTPRSIWTWLAQFPRSSWPQLVVLLGQVIYLSEAATVQALVQLNRSLLAKLRMSGIDLDRVIYVAVDDAGSSSHVMLSLLRDAENLERRGARFVGSREARRLMDLTRELREGALVYVDDFAGTGKQFRRNRDSAMGFIAGAFSEFFIVPVLCEEALRRISEVDVVVETSFVHTVDQRPLHRYCNSMTEVQKTQMVSLCKQINRSCALGFGNLATMVVLYRNAPNTMPLVFRGSLKQTPFRGIFPRSDDLPF